MDPVLIQIIFRQWDKGQRSEADRLHRAAQPDRYALSQPGTRTSADGHVIIDCHGDDRLGNRLQYRASAAQLYIDRFCLDLNQQQLDYHDDSRLHSLGELTAPWCQYRYQWRYRVHESDMIYWLYEEVILNIAPPAPFETGRFLAAAPARSPVALPTPTSNHPFRLAAQHANHNRP